MSNAIRKGDRAAEVILRQCDTTPILDRSAIESTCDEDPTRHAIAIKRLKEIGFVPALPFQPELKPEWKAMMGASVVQPLISRNVKELETRKNSTPALCSSYRSRPSDEKVRFNLVMVIGLALKDQRDEESLRDAAAKCLTEAMADPSPMVRAEAAYAIRFHPLPKTLELLKKLNESDYDQQVIRTSEDSLRMLSIKH